MKNENILLIVSENLKMHKKIDYLTVCYINYDLIFLQIKNFKKRFKRESYRFIVVDNTPPQFKKQELINELKNNDIIDVFIEISDSKITTAIDRKNGWDEGLSHGGALEEGLKYCNSDIICIFDSDFFILDNDMNEYIWDKFNNGYLAVGVTFDMNPFSRKIIDRNPSEFLNIPILIGAFYTNELAKSSRLITATEEAESSYRNNGTDVETGFRLRKYIAKNKLKTMTWNMKYGRARETQYITNEYDKIIAVHGWAGSHQNNTQRKMNELRNIIDIN